MYKQTKIDTSAMKNRPIGQKDILQVGIGRWKTRTEDQTHSPTYYDILKAHDTVQRHNNYQPDVTT